MKMMKGKLSKQFSGFYGANGFPRNATPQKFVKCLDCDTDYLVIANVICCNGKIILRCPYCSALEKKEKI